MIPVATTQRLWSRKPPLDALDDVHRIFSEQGARIEETDSASLIIRMGSRTTFRLFGVSGPGPRHLPIKVKVHAGADTSSSTGHETLLTLTMEEDAGWYLLRLGIADAAYRHHFKEIIDGLVNTGTLFQ